MWTEILTALIRKRLRMRNQEHSIFNPVFGFGNNQVFKEVKKSPKSSQFFVWQYIPEKKFKIFVKGIKYNM